PAPRAPAAPTTAATTAPPSTGVPAASAGLWAAQARWMLLPLGLLGWYAPSRADETPAARG
ncbi:MAG: hypothetical protein KGO01_19045, partial [Burkholderiales bacterium]|nr:hypothetical protein [Burkholderiales bacterium]